jgi:DNA-binding NarL/FixJ family response regulator
VVNFCKAVSPDKERGWTLKYPLHDQVILNSWINAQLVEQFNMPVSILLFEDNQLLRESISGLLEVNEEFHLSGAYENALNVMEKVETNKPDIILMDIDMPGMSGIEAVKEIRRLNNAVPILMLTVFDDDTHVFKALYAGASGYLLKKHILTRLFDAMYEVLDGGAPMSPSIARMVIGSMQKPAENAYHLTPRELEILQFLSEGNSYKMIATQLDISIDTVRAHLKKVYTKLHVHSQTEAVIKALQEKLV